MINPTWQDAERRVVFVSSNIIGCIEEDMSNIDLFTTKDDHGVLVSWNEKEVVIKLDGKALSKTCLRKNLFWEDGEPDFDELRSLKK